ncbi:polysaccharide biosynthesis/export family protein [Limimaricola litoreus]|uniref:Polysaccharide export protein n=1 Tax=Limimaricola litoreus TaxID=2955316 RepID=A0A9X2FNB4_9RHOB|nr:polysaccharide biosynthesis/export family protein [Limimaricola litoreus]MCP1168382.1 polysaccharide export protein [Limimaricola litoreus]
MLLTTISASAQNYQLKPGDTVTIEVLEDPSINRQTFVLPDGTINVPLAGTIRAAGRSLSQIERNISTALAPNFAVPPTVFVGVAALATPEEEPPLPERVDPVITAFVTGEIGNPGVRSMPEGTKLLQFLALAGDFGPFAATKRLQLRRTNPDGTTQIILIDYDALLRGAALLSNFTILDGDVLVVPQRRLFE